MDCSKKMEQMGWIREDFIEQLHLSSTNLILGQSDQEHQGSKQKPV